MEKSITHCSEETFDPEYATVCALYCGLGVLCYVFAVNSGFCESSSSSLNLLQFNDLIKKKSIVPEIILISGTLCVI